MTIQEQLMDRKQYVVDQYLNGISMTELGKEFNCNSGSICYFLKNNNIETREKVNKKGSIEKHKDFIQEKHFENWTAGSIAREIKFSTVSVTRYAETIGLSFAHHSSHKNEVRLKDRVDEILSLHKKGLSGNAIAEKMGYAATQVSVYLKQSGVDVTRNTYDVDLNFFDIIDTEEKAYILGFWYADGNNKRDGIRIQVCDKEIPEKFKEAMKYTGPITYVKPRTERHQAQWLLSISRKELSEALTKLGCHPNKTFTLKFPTEYMIPPHLIRHFIRGYNDGDGNIYNYKKDNRWKVQIVGTKEFLQGVSNSSVIKGGWSKRHKDRDNNNYNWYTVTKKETLLLLDWLYSDSTIYLQRKYDKYLEFKADAKWHKNIPE